MFQQLTETASNGEVCIQLSQRTLVLLLFQPYPLFRGNRVQQHTEQEESLASVKDNEVVGACAVRIEERPRTIRIDRVESVRCGEIGPGSDSTVTASGVANGAPESIRQALIYLDRSVHASACAQLLVDGCHHED